MPETARQYKQRLLELVKGRDPVRLQGSTPRRIAGLIHGVPRARLVRRPASGKWSVGEIVAHLADDELVGGYRMRLIVGAPGTPIQAFDQEEWAKRGKYGRRDPKKSLALFRSLREANIAFYKSLSPAELGLCGLHAERGKESVKEIFALFAGHDLNHLKQIEAILASQRGR